MVNRQDVWFLVRERMNILLQPNTVKQFLLRPVSEELPTFQHFTWVDEYWEGCIAWAQSSTLKHFSQRKDVDLRHSYIMNLIKEEIIPPTCMLTSHIRAVVLTRPLRPRTLRMESSATKMTESKRRIKLFCGKNKRLVRKKKKMPVGSNYVITQTYNFFRMLSWPIHFHNILKQNCWRF